MLALAVALFVWQDQLCRAILIVKTLHNLVNMSELVYKRCFLKRDTHFENTRLHGMLTLCYNTYELHYPHDELTFKKAMVPMATFMKESRNNVVASQ